MTTGANVPLHWSVANNQNIVWRTTLPEEGQSGIAVWGNRLFLTTMKPLAADATKKTGHEVVGYCLDSGSGRILWTVDLPGSVDSNYAYGFSDSTTPTPMTDGQHVWFYNSSGSVGCWDYHGKPVWLREWHPTEGRPFNKQFEPMLVGHAVLNMEPRDLDDPRREPNDPWNYLRGLDQLTGKTLWIADDALTHYNTPMAGTLPDGTPAVLQGRGAYHGAPEAPSGLSLTSLADGHAGRTLWRFEGPGRALYTMQWDQQNAYWLTEDGGEHLVIDVQTGKLRQTQSLTEKVDWQRFDPATGDYILQAGVDLKQLNPPINVFPAWFTNIVVEGCHYFLCFTDAVKKVGPPHCVGRVNVATGKVEYLELPVQVVSHPGAADSYLWGQAEPSSTVDARGVDVAGDPRSKRDGWYWCMLPHPTAVDGKIFFTTMTGLTYVIDGRARVLDRHALLAVNDLGPAGQTWSLNSISYANGRLYHRSMKEVVCIGTQ
jgi:outer membrane protein assembly factor BamB